MFLTLIVLTVTTVLFLLNSTKTIQWAADTYAPRYGFSYKQISGGLLTGLEVEELTFKDDRLLDSLKVGWNPASILYNQVSFTHLEASGVNVENINKVVETFIPAKSQEEDTSVFVLPFSIGVGELHLTVKPFEESGIGFKDISLDGEGIVYYGEGVDVDDLTLSIDTNVTTIQLSGGIEEKNIRVKNLSILDVDTIAFQDVIEKMIAIHLEEKIVEEIEPEIKQYRAGKDNFIPKSVFVDSAIVRVKSADHPQIRLNQGEMNVSSVKVDIHRMIDYQPNTVQVGDLSVLLDTNLSRLSMNSKLEDETITVESLSLHDIDTIALKKLFESIENNQTVRDETLDTNNTVNPLLPKFLYVKHIDSSIKSATYYPVFVKSAEVNATNVKVNIGTLTAESGEVDVAFMSNFSSLVQHGVLKDNHIESNGYITAHKELFEIYGLPWKEATFNPFALNIKTDKKQIVVDYDLKDGKLLQSEVSAFTVEDISLTNQIVYVFSESKLRVQNEGNISTSYAKEVHVENVLTLEDGVLNYMGKVTPGKLEGIDNNYTKLLNDLKISYRGDGKSIEADIDSEGVKGKFVSADFKKGDLRLSTKQALELKNMISLPKELEPSKMTVDIHVPLDFLTITPLHAKAKVRSNLANVDADLLYEKELKVISKTIVPEDSLLRAFSPKLNLDALSPLEADLSMVEKGLHVDIRSKGLKSKVKFNPENKDLDGNMVLGGAEFVFKGNVEKKLSLENSVSSLEGLLKKISTIYAYDVPPLDGDVKVSLTLTDMKDVELKLNSNTLTYKADSKTEYKLNNTMLSFGFADSSLTLNKYHTTFQEQKIFAAKPSVITFNEGIIDISPLWINDELKVTGRYNIENKKGEILAFADPLNISHELVDLVSRLDLNTSLENNETAISGTITILGGDIHYDMDIKTFSSDSDIINGEELKKKKSSPFMDNLNTYIRVKTEKPLIYKTEDADIEATADFLIQKSLKGPMNVLGTVEILEGSSYSYENKKFVFDKSFIAFAGDPKKPILDMTAIYKTTKTAITIQVTGSPPNPNITFSSIPRMTRHEILSTLLFASQDDAEDLSEDDMMKMVGGSMAQSVFANPAGAVVKSAFSSVGINIDQLPFIGRSSDANKTKKALFSFFSTEDKVVIPTHEIHFTGQQHIDEKKLQKAMGVDTKSIFQFWKEDKPTIKDKLLPTLEESLRNFYDSEGFYDSKFSIKTSKNNVTVSIDENQPVKIRDINIRSDYDISDLITFEKGKIFRSKEFVSIKRNIDQKLMKDGYCSYDLDSKAYVDLATYEVNVHFKLEKGGVCTFGKVTVKGLETIDDSVVISRVRAREGERFSSDRLKETYDALYNLDAFDYLTVKHDLKFYNVVPIDIEVSEVERPWYFKGDVDFDTTVGLSVSAEVLRTNFMGNAKNISLGLKFSEIENRIWLGYFVPALFKVSEYYIDLTTKIGYSEFKYEGFREEKGYAEALLSYNDEKWNIDAGLAIENIDILPRNPLAIPSVGAGNFLPIYPFLRFSYDNRDSKIHPKYGYYIGGMVEYGLPYDEEKESSYLKYGLEGRAIHTFSNLTLGAVAKVGIVDQGGNEIPESKLFFAGGDDTNRAYGYKRVGVITSPTSYTIEGGSTMANLSIEANYPIREKLYAAVFTDNTMLTKDVYDFSGDILSSAGVGIRYITPFGPIKVDVGMNVQDVSEFAIHFKIGQSF
jgi:outer membrane protein assembly factor BamA